MQETVPKMTAALDVQRVLQEYPDLGRFGFGTVAIMPDEDFIKQVNVGRNWLTTTPAARFVMCHCGSYAIKHMIEKAHGAYISNGAAIAAAMLEGFEPVRKRPGPNCYFVRRIL